MKKIVLIFTSVCLAFTSCKTSQIGGDTDDVYANPSEEKKLNQLAAQERLKKEAEEKQSQENAALAQKQKIAGNPYYKDPSYNQDDYYDYQYASRVRRFGQPVNGLGYYDNYYTNSYWYNHNPASYGTSIYSSYNYLMPSNQFNNYSSGLSMSFSSGNYGYNNYNNYGYNPYGYNSYGSYGYNPYGYNPYNNGFANGYNAGFYSGLYGNNHGYNGYGHATGWGYFNGYDVNSGYSTYGVRGSNGGGNDPRGTTAGMAIPEGFDGERGKLFNEIRQKQESTPRFTESQRSNTNFNNDNLNQGSTKTGRGTNYSNSPSNNGNNGVSNPSNNNSFEQNNGNSGSTKTRNNQPVINSPSEDNSDTRNNNNSSKRVNSNTRNENNYDFNNNNNSNRSMENNNSNNNSSPSPRGGGGESTTRPR